VLRNACFCAATGSEVAIKLRGLLDSAEHKYQSALKLSPMLWEAHTGMAVAQIEKLVLNYLILQAGTYCLLLHSAHGVCASPYLYMGE